MVDCKSAAASSKEEEVFFVVSEESTKYRGSEMEVMAMEVQQEAQ